MLKTKMEKYIATHSKMDVLRNYVVQMTKAPPPPPSLESDSSHTKHKRNLS